MHRLCHILRGMKHANGSFFALFGVFSLVHQASEAAFHRSNCKRRSTSRKWRNRGWVTSQKSASTSRKATNSKYVLTASKLNFCGANEAKGHSATFDFNNKKYAIMTKASHRDQFARRPYVCLSICLSVRLPCFVFASATCFPRNTGF